ncbi:MAG TPA: NAD-dependent deacylase [Bacteroidota bacterium]|nr:NAD-dependent deacylase [Bacteroidota bacterium]
MRPPSSPAFSDNLLTRLAGAGRVAVLTGAGISAESGVPTFRGDEGIWKKFRPEELANVNAFIRNPELVWEWYKHRKTLMATVQPNPGHAALAAMESHHAQVTVITQNIDDLHRRAGSHNVLELHGNINRNYCIACGTSVSNEDILRQEAAPRCPACRGLVRPDVVWFGELLPVDIWDESVRAAERAEVFFAIGTSAVVHPAASLPGIAKKAGAYLVEVNIEDTELSWHADEVLIGKAGDILPRLLNSYVSLSH